MVAEVPFRLTATVMRDDGTVDTEFNGTVSHRGGVVLAIAGYGNFIPSSIVGSTDVSADHGVATFNLTVDPAPWFRLTVSAVVPDPNVEGGFSAISAQTNLERAALP